MGYLLPFDRSIQLGQQFGSNPGWGPNPAGGHNGDDWLTPVGVPVHAAGDGYVLFAGQYDSTYEDNFGWGLNYGGNQVVLNLDGPTGPYVEYGHLSVMYVKSGERVAAGQIIALTGATDGGTGVITGPHCHVGVLPWNYNLNTNTYGRVNPRLYLTDYPDAGSLLAQSGTITPIQEDEDMAITDEDLLKIYDTVWFGRPGAKLIPNEAAGNAEWPYTTLGSLTARINRDIVRPQIADLKGSVSGKSSISAAEVADAVIEAVGKDLAAEVVAALGQKLGGIK